jgi:thiamine pyrophosphate-dependent acetolactate synthase large subunit-like protein
MHLDRIKGKADDEMAWGSDVAAQMLRQFKIPFISLNPGASYRGFHDSIVNHLGNETPGMILCLHEDHSVAIAHGYAKATGEPMACVLHSNVGLLHGSMSLFNAWLDRAPMLVLGATGPLDATKRRPWIDWIHTSRDQAGLVRSFIKWDDQPSSPQALVESLCRANIMTRSAPTAPVYVVLDAGLQEMKLDNTNKPEMPDLSRFTPPPAPAPGMETVDAVVALLKSAKKPLILIGRNGRRQEQWDARVKLAESLGAVVMTDLKNGAAFPTDHPAQVVPPYNQLNKSARQVVGEADLVLSLDWIDLGGAIRQGKASGAFNAKVVHCSLDSMLHSGAHMDYQELPAVDIRINACPDQMVAALNRALGAGAKKSPWRKAFETSHKPREQLHLTHVALALKEELGADAAKASFTGLARGWPIELFPFKDPQGYMGKDGGGGIGSGPGISVGAALGLSRMGRLPIGILGDGDFAMGSTALWSATHHKIPLLLILNNNRSYFNDELHQETVAVRRGREPANRWIGQRLSEPDVDFATLAQSYGCIGIGPVKTVAELKVAVGEGVAALKAGKVCLIDCWIEPTEERSAQSSLEVRVTD